MMWKIYKCEGKRGKIWENEGENEKRKEKWWDFGQILLIFLHFKNILKNINNVTIYDIYVTFIIVYCPYNVLFCSYF